MTPKTKYQNPKLSYEQMGDILHIMAYLTNGIIFELLQSDNNKSYDEILDYLEDTAEYVIAGYKIKKGAHK